MLSRTRKRKASPLRVFELHSGLGLGVGLEAAGLSVIDGFDVGLTRLIRMQNGIPTVPYEHDDIGEHAAAALEISAELIASYPLTDQQMSHFALTVGAVRPEWALCIHPEDSGLFDPTPLMWRYDYGITRITLEARSYRVPEAVRYVVLVGRLGSEDGFLFDSLAERALGKNPKMPSVFAELNAMEQLTVLKGLPRELFLFEPTLTESSLAAALQTACPPMLAFHVGRAIDDRYRAEDIPDLHPDFKEYVERVLKERDVARGKATPVTKKDKAARVKKRAAQVDNILSRVRRARRLLMGRTFRSTAVELEALQDVFERRASSGKPIGRAVQSDMINALKLYGTLPHCRHERIYRPTKDHFGLQELLDSGRYDDPPTSPKWTLKQLRSAADHFTRRRVSASSSKASDTAITDANKRKMDLNGSRDAQPENVIEDSSDWPPPEPRRRKRVNKVKLTPRPPRKPRNKQDDTTPT